MREELIQVLEILVKSIELRTILPKYVHRLAGFNHNRCSVYGFKYPKHIREIICPGYCYRRYSSEKWLVQTLSSMLFHLKHNPFPYQISRPVPEWVINRVLMAIGPYLMDDRFLLAS